MMRAINPFMNGEFPMRPAIPGLFGSCSGAPGGKVNRANRTRTPRSPKPAQRRSRESSAERPAPPLVGFVPPLGGFLGFVGAEPGLDDPLGDECNEDRQEGDGHEGKPEVGSQPDRL